MILSLEQLVIDNEWLAAIAHILRLVRTNMIDVMVSDYVQMARLKGVPYWDIVFKHALPNAMLPTINVVALTLAWLLGGVAIIETKDPDPLTSWLLKWNSMVDVQSVPVLDDQEARELGRQAL